MEQIFWPSTLMVICLTTSAKITKLWIVLKSRWTEGVSPNSWLMRLERPRRGKCLRISRWRISKGMIWMLTTVKVPPQWVECDLCETFLSVLRFVHHWLKLKFFHYFAQIGTIQLHIFQLHIAAANGYISVVEFLLEHGVRTDAKDKDDWQPAHAAACWGHVSCWRNLENPSDFYLDTSSFSWKW